MLVLTRSPGERVLVGDFLVVTVVQCKGGKVRLGFEAPRDVPIVREEAAVIVREERDLSVVTETSGGA